MFCHCKCPYSVSFTHTFSSTRLLTPTDSRYFLHFNPQIICVQLLQGANGKLSCGKRWIFTFSVARMQRNDLPFIIVNSPIMNCSFLREFRIFRIFHSVIIFCSPSCLFFFGWAEIKSKDFEILQNMKTIRFRPFFLFLPKGKIVSAWMIYSTGIKQWHFFVRICCC